MQILLPEVPTEAMSSIIMPGVERNGGSVHIGLQIDWYTRDLDSLDRNIRAGIPRGCSRSLRRFRRLLLQNLNNWDSSPENR